MVKLEEEVVDDLPATDVVDHVEVLRRRRVVAELELQVFGWGLGQWLPHQWFRFFGGKVDSMGSFSDKQSGRLDFESEPNRCRSRWRGPRRWIQMKSDKSWCTDADADADFGSDDF